MRTYLDLTSWILLFFFAPFTVLVLLSQNTIPGEFFYPVKRGLENMILVAYSVSPSAKVGYRTDLTQRRFSEAQQLLVSKADTTAYNQFIDEVFTTSQDLSKLSDSSDRIEKSEKLLGKIEEYKTQLVQVETQVQIAQALPQQTSTQTQETVQQSPQTSTFQVQQTTSPVPQQLTSSPTPTAFPPTTQFTPAPAQSSVPTQVTSSPTVQQPAQTAPPLATTVTNTIATNPVKAEEVKKKVEDTRRDLEKAEKEARKIKEEAEIEEKAKEERRRLQENLKEQGRGERSGRSRTDGNNDEDND